MPDKKIFESKIEPLWNKYQHKFRRLNEGEISCMLKHMKAIEYISKSEFEFCLVLEDDAIPINSDYLKMIEDYVKDTPTNWDAIWMGFGCGLDFINDTLKRSKKVNEKIAKISHPATNCTEAYLLKKESACRIRDSLIPFQLGSDFELAYQFYKLNMNIYWLINPLFYQGSKTGTFKSEIR